MKFIIILGIMAISLETTAASNCELLSNFISINRNNLLLVLKLKATNAQLAKAQQGLKSHLVKTSKETSEYGCGDLISAVTEDFRLILEAYKSKAHK